MGGLHKREFEREGVRERAGPLEFEMGMMSATTACLNGLETIRAIRELPFPVKLIILTIYKQEDMFNTAMI